MTYNLTFGQNLTGFMPFLQGVNSATGELLTGLILISVFIVLFISFKNFETVTALMSASFIASLLAVLFYSIEFLSIQYTIMPIVLLGITILYKIASKE